MAAAARSIDAFRACRAGPAGRVRFPRLPEGEAYNLPDAWQIGMNPTITSNDRASSGNKWNVPVGLCVGKTVKWGDVPVNIEVGVEYSVVGPDDFGQQALFRVQITPVIPSLIKISIFGGYQKVGSAFR
jgi:hypothetical protein